jgi:hypothetical protein
MNRIVVDRTGEIENDVNAIRLLIIRVPVVVFVNNHFAGMPVRRSGKFRKP